MTKFCHFKENDKNMSIIKNRIVKFVDYKGFNKKEFYNSIGSSDSNFRSSALKSEVNASVITKILSETNVNAIWLITGEGEMLTDTVSDKDPLTRRIIRITQEFPLDYKKFCDKIGRNYKKNGSFYNPFSIAEIAGVIKLFPQVDPVWIITGESIYPLTPNNQVALIIKNENDLVSVLQDKIGNLNYKIEYLSNIIESKDILLVGKEETIKSNMKYISNLENKNK